MNDIVYVVEGGKVAPRRRGRASKLKMRELREKNLSKGLAGARGAVVKSLANDAIVHQKRV